MIASISKSGGDGALNYNLEKLDKEQGELLDTNILIIDPKKDLSNEFKDVANLNKRVKKNIFHASLSLPDGEKISSEKFTKIGKEYMEKMGFKNTPYAIFEHHDTKNQHIHIVASRVKNDGKCVSDKMERYKSQKVSRELEQKYDLKPTKSTKQGYDKKNLKEINANKHSSVSLVKKDLKNVLNYNLKHSSTQKEFENKCKKDHVYLRVLNGEYTYGGKNASVDEKIYFKEKQLPQNLSYQSINQHFKRIEEEKSNIQQVVEKPQQEKQPNEIVIQIKIPAKRKEPIQEPQKEVKKESLWKKSANFVSKTAKSIFATQKEQKPRDEPKKQLKQEAIQKQEPQQIKDICKTIEDLIINEGGKGFDKAAKILENHALTDNDAIKIAQNKNLTDIDRTLILDLAGKTDFWKHSPEEQNRQRKSEEARKERQQMRQSRSTKTRSKGNGKDFGMGK